MFKYKYYFIIIMNNIYFYSNSYNFNGPVST